jgi:hypothetical protein
MNTDTQENQERLLFKNAPWDKIREAVQRQKEAGFGTDDVDQMVSRLTTWVNDALEAHCPRAKAIAVHEEVVERRSYGAKEVIYILEEQSLHNAEARKGRCRAAEHCIASEKALPQDDPATQEASLG